LIHRQFYFIDLQASVGNAKIIILCPRPSFIGGGGGRFHLFGGWMAMAVAARGDG